MFVWEDNNLIWLILFVVNCVFFRWMFGLLFIEVFYFVWGMVLKFLRFLKGEVVKLSKDNWL